MSDNRPYTFDRVFRSALTVGVIWGLIHLMGFLSEVLLPFAVAFLMAYLLNPLVNRIQTWVGHRLVAILISLTLVAGVAVGALCYVTPMVAKEVRHLGGVVKEIAQESPMAAKIRDQVGPEILEVIRDAREDPRFKDYILSNDMTDSLKKGSIAIFKSLSPKAVGFLKGTLNIALGMLGLSVVLLYLIFLLLDYDAVRKEWEGLLPEKWKKPLVDFVGDFDQIMNRHFRAQALVALIVGILFAVGFSFISLPMAILFGLVIGAMNMVPYLQVLAIPPALVLAVLSAVEHDQSLMQAGVMVLVVFAVIQIIQDAVLTPKIMGEVTGLRPAIILLSLSIWGKMLGMLGLLIALPMTCLVLAYYRRFILGKPSTIGNQP